MFSRVYSLSESEKLPSSGNAQLSSWLLSLSAWSHWAQGGKPLPAPQAEGEEASPALSVRSSASWLLTRGTVSPFTPHSFNSSFFSRAFLFWKVLWILNKVLRNKEWLIGTAPKWGRDSLSTSNPSNSQWFLETRPPSASDENYGPSHWNMHILYTQHFFFQYQEGQEPQRPIWEKEENTGFTWDTEPIFL